jgi:hypothetical protein
MSNKNTLWKELHGAVPLKSFIKKPNTPKKG